MPLRFSFNFKIGFCPEDHIDVKNVKCEPACLFNLPGSNEKQVVTTGSTIRSTKKLETVDSIRDQTTLDPAPYFKKQRYLNDTEYNKLSLVRHDETSAATIEGLKTFTSATSTSNYNQKRIPQGDKNAYEKFQHRRRRYSEKRYISKRDSSIDLFNTNSNYYEERDLPIVRHPYGKSNVRCRSLNHSTCTPERIVFKAHGPQTGMCVASDR